MNFITSNGIEWVQQITEIKRLGCYTKCIPKKIFSLFAPRIETHIPTITESVRVIKQNESLQNKFIKIMNYIKFPIDNSLIIYPDSNSLFNQDK